MMQYICSEFQEVVGEKTTGHTQLLSSISNGSMKDVASSQLDIRKNVNAVISREVWEAGTKPRREVFAMTNN